MGNFIEDLTSITCLSCQGTMVKLPYKSPVYWEADVMVFKEHHESCNGPLMNRITKMLVVRGINPHAAVKTAGYIHLVITTGHYNDIVATWNKNSREIFMEITGVKLPKSDKQTALMFTDKPFEVIHG